MSHLSSPSSYVANLPAWLLGACVCSLGNYSLHDVCLPVAFPALSVLCLPKRALFILLNFASWAISIQRGRKWNLLSIKLCVYGGRKECWTFLWGPSDFSPSVTIEERNERTNKQNKRQFVLSSGKILRNINANLLDLFPVSLLSA